MYECWHRGVWRLNHRRSRRKSPPLACGTFSPTQPRAKIGPQIADKLYRDVGRILQTPDVREPLTAQGYELVDSTPAEFAAYIKTELERYSQIVRAAGIKIE